eukprot:217647_1
MATNNKKRKRLNSGDNSSLPSTKKPRNIRQTYLDSDTIITSLQFHPTTHTFAASCFDGKINLYHIDELKTTKLIQTFHHPTHNKEYISQTQSLKELIKSNKEKMERLKELQINNNYDNNDYDNSDYESDNNSDSLSLISIN